MSRHDTVMSSTLVNLYYYVDKPGLVLAAAQVNMLIRVVHLKYVIQIPDIGVKCLINKSFSSGAAR